MKLITLEELHAQVLELLNVEARMQKTDSMCPLCKEIYSDERADKHQHICPCDWYQ